MDSGVEPQGPSLPDQWFTELGKICNAFASLESHLHLYYSMLAELHIARGVWDQAKGLQESSAWPAAEVVKKMSQLLEERVPTGPERDRRLAVLESLRPIIRERNEYIHAIWTVAKVWKPGENPALAEYSHSFPSRIKVRGLPRPDDLGRAWTLQDLQNCQARIIAGRLALVECMKGVERHLV